MSKFLIQILIPVFLFGCCVYSMPFGKEESDDSIGCEISIELAKKMMDDPEFNGQALRIKEKLFDPKGGKIPLEDIKEEANEACPLGGSRFLTEVADRDQDGKLSFEEFKKCNLKLLRKIADPDGCVPVTKAEQAERNCGLDMFRAG